MNDIDREVEKLEKLGFRVISSVKFQKGGGAVHFNTAEVGGIMFELVEWPRE